MILYDLITAYSAVGDSKKSTFYTNLNKDVDRDLAPYLEKGRRESIEAITRVEEVLRQNRAKNAAKQGKKAAESTNGKLDRALGGISSERLAELFIEEPKRHRNVFKKDSLGLSDIISGRTLMATSEAHISLKVMEDFYRSLKGSDKADALRTAQLKLLKNKKNKNPYYWAAFYLIGDYR